MTSLTSAEHSTQQKKPPVSSSTQRRKGFPMKWETKGNGPWKFNEQSAFSFIISWHDEVFKRKTPARGTESGNCNGLFVVAAVASLQPGTTVLALVTPQPVSALLSLQSPSPTSCLSPAPHSPPAKKAFGVFFNFFFFCTCYSLLQINKTLEAQIRQVI